MLKTECIHFPLDRPCVFHKAKGITCDICPKFIPVTKANKNKEILIVKLGAMGDVLRTTFLLPGLKKKYKNCRITWVVAGESVQLLENNPYLSEIWVFDNSLFSKLSNRFFDAVINLDLSPESLSIAAVACAKEKKGFWIDGKRNIKYSNLYAKKWLLMSGSDPVKKRNRKTYQYWMSKIVGFPRPDYGIYTPLSKSSLAKAKRFALAHGLSGKTVVGINPGAGGRWKYKKWTDTGFIKVINALSEQGKKVLLFGGKGEEALIKKLVKGSKNKAISTGTNNSIPDFFALLNLTDMVLTGDTLALHAALGLGKKVVAVFGPTSSAEIEMYGLGRKVASGLDCACCYRPSCNIKPNCMQTIKPDQVLRAIKSLSIR
jgi:ADP-heptose:LPS heptosyltransferase